MMTKISSDHMGKCVKAFSEEPQLIRTQILYE